jgi:predicted Zn-ribbon and HTH transcriptional regulator
VTVVAPPPAEGEDLLKIAADEEQDIQRVRKTLRSKDTFVIFCPNGCRIRVKERHRGKTGKCPRCQSEFVVPRKLAPKKPDAPGEGTAEPAVVITSKYVKWLSNIRLHTVDPLKLRIKADSLLYDCAAVDIGFSADDLLMATLIAGKFGANPKKVQPLRQAMIEHFLKGGTLETLNVVAKKVYLKELVSQVNLAQPTSIGTESLFAGIPVFGVNRIAVKLPKLPDDSHAKYLSFSLSEFRAFTEGLQSVFGIEGLGANTEIPLTDEYATHKCHLSQSNVLELAKVPYYQKDPGFKLEISGWKCAACGIIVGETARAAAKLGGANGKALPKTKCPKCSLKFGNLPPMYQLEGAGAPAPQSQAVEEPAATTA